MMAFPLALCLAATPVAAQRSGKGSASAAACPQSKPIAVSTDERPAA